MKSKIYWLTHLHCGDKMFYFQHLKDNYKLAFFTNIFAIQ